MINDIKFINCCPGFSYEDRSTPTLYVIEPHQRAYILTIIYACNEHAPLISVTLDHWNASQRLLINASNHLNRQPH